METDVKTAQPVYQVPKPPAAKPEAKEVVYTAQPGDPLAADSHGHRFVSGVPRMIENDHILGLVDGNPSFSFKGQDKAAELAKRQQEDAKRADDERVATLKMEAEEMAARHKSEADALKARHDRELAAMKARASPPAAPTKEDLATGRPKTVAEVEAERAKTNQMQQQAAREHDI
jgi:hypothetical protein